REPSQIGIELRGVFTRSEAHRGGIYRFDGTSPEDPVVLLQQYGMQSALTTGTTMEALEQALAGGHKVIAAVNAETIWSYPRDEGQRTQADHAVVVTRVDTPLRHRPPQRQGHPQRPRRADPHGHLHPRLGNRQRPAHRHPTN